MSYGYTAPEVQLKAFHCPYCQVYALQRWYSAGYWNGNRGTWASMEGYSVCICDSCDSLSTWHNGRMAVPDTSAAPTATQEMPDDVREDYNEARAAFPKSPRSSAALLRLAVQKLCIDLGGSGKNLNDDIGALVKKGLPVDVQQALDVVRVIGNNQVHPGVLDLRDDPESASALFGLVNFIVEVMITRPKQIKALFGKLPTTAQQQIQKRDATKP